MCGIAGIVHYADPRPVSPAILRAMTSRIHHRGPDDWGYEVDDNAGAGIAMRRLSIVDLEGGHQPMSNEDGSVQVVFNGEIYNHGDLRPGLAASGHRFRTRSDTEAIVHAYEEHGADCPSFLNGMFAFAVWDRNRRRLLLARDRVGIKPLYYTIRKGTLVFASELTALLASEEVPRELEPAALDAYLTWEYVPAPLSILRGVHKLPPAHILVLEEGRTRIAPYWELDPEAVLADEPESDAARLAHLRELLNDAVRIRLMADVPLGAFLSGGVDSTGIVGLMAGLMDRPVKSFSIGFDDPTYNELPWASRAAELHGCEHHEEVLHPDAEAWTKKVLAYQDEPLGDFSCIPTYLVSETARRHVKVVLSGDGGDELFAGYDAYRAERLAGTYARLPRGLRSRLVEPLAERLPPSPAKKGLLNKAKRFVEGATLPAELGHARWMIFLRPEERDSLYADGLAAAVRKEDPYAHVRKSIERAVGTDALNRALYVDLTTYLVDNILVKVDRMSMAVSLEARVPYLDHRVVEYVTSLPARLKFHGGKAKVALKAALDDLIPDDIANRSKEGFSIPIKNWLKMELRPMLEDHLSTARLKQRSLFRPEAVRRLVESHLAGRANHSHKLWALMILESWSRRVLDPPVAGRGREVASHGGGP
jgi:asparagine synthase (glutamine-hydrolysing)